LEGEGDDFLGRDLEGVGELADGDELGHADQRLLALLLLAPLLLFEIADARALFPPVHAPLAHGALDGREGARDVLRHRLLVHQRLLPLLALLALLAPPLLERNRARRGGGDGPGRNAATRNGARHRLGPHGSGNEPAGDRRRGGARGRRLRGLPARLLGRGQRLEQRSRALLRRQRRQVTAHEDVHLLEHADQLLAGDAEFRRQVMNPRRCHHPPEDATSPRASPASATPTACTAARPSPAPSRSAAGPRTTGTPRASASRSTLSRVRGLASAASTTQAKRPRCSRARTPATPSTTRRARSPKPNRRVTASVTPARGRAAEPRAPLP